jgi:CDP-paratose 2-epimerase
LITGGAGFIGANLADHYLAHGKHVTILDNFSRCGSEDNVRWLLGRHGNRLGVLQADVRRAGQKLAELVEWADVVFHLAAHASATTATDPRRDFEANALGTFNLLEAVRRSCSRPVLVYSSTTEVYGPLASVEVELQHERYGLVGWPEGIPETVPLDCHSSYASSKGIADQYVTDYSRIYNLQTVVFRQSCIYGPHQSGAEDQGWMAWFARQALQDQPVVIHGDGRQVRDVLYAGDLISAYDAAVEAIERTAGQAYNIGGGPRLQLSLLEYVELLQAALERPVRYSFADWRPGDQRVFVSDIRKAKKHFDWEPRVRAEEGIEELVTWLRGDQQSTRATPAHPRRSSVPDQNGTQPRGFGRTSVSIIIPARNEEATLAPVLRDLYEAIGRLDNYQFEVLCVDDHSTDATASIARSFGATLIKNTATPGKGMALRTGFGAASGDILVMMDADYSHRAEDLHLFLEALDDDVGLVIGSRVFGGSEEYTHIRALGNVFLSATLGICTGRYLSDALNGYKAMRREVFTNFTYTSSSFEMEIEIVANALRTGHRIVEVSSHERNRAGGQAKSKIIQHGIRFLMRILWEGMRGVKPMQPGIDPTEVVLEHDAQYRPAAEAADTALSKAR